jgi:hypothetical protein
MTGNLQVLVNLSSDDGSKPSLAPLLCHCCYSYIPVMESSASIDRVWPGAYRGMSGFLAALLAPLHALTR